MRPSLRAAIDADRCPQKKCRPSHGGPARLGIAIYAAYLKTKMVFGLPAPPTTLLPTVALVPNEET